MRMHGLIRKSQQEKAGAKLMRKPRTLFCYALEAVKNRMVTQKLNPRNFNQDCLRQVAGILIKQSKGGIGVVETCLRTRKELNQ